MNPNNNDPNATPPVDDTNPVPPVSPETSEAPATPAPEATPVTPQTPVTPEVPATPAAPVEPITPATPPTPVTPDAATPFAAGTPVTGPEAPKTPKVSKKTILIAAIAGGVILLAIIAVIIFMALTTVSKADYREAVRQYNTVKSASSSLSADVSLLGSASGSTPDATFNERVSEVKNSIEKLKSENDELSKLKAVKVGDGAKFYNTFADKLKAYLAYGSEMVTSVENLRPALVTCDKTSDATSAAASIAAIKSCASELAGIKDIPNAQMKTYITALADNYSKYSSSYEKANALTDRFGSQSEEYRTLRTEMSEALKAVSTAGTTFRNDLKTRDDELSVKDSANKLGDYLDDQQKS